MRLNGIGRGVKHFLAHGVLRGQNGTVRSIRQIAVIGLILVGLAGVARAQETPWENAANAAHRASPVHEPARVDLNRASIAELMRVPGMTESWAGRIVRYRPYRTKLDLLERGVVTGAAYERIKDYVIAHRLQKPDEKTPPAK